MTSLPLRPWSADDGLMSLSLVEEFHIRRPFDLRRLFQEFGRSCTKPTEVESRLAAHDVPTASVPKLDGYVLSPISSLVGATSHEEYGLPCGL